MFFPPRCGHGDSKWEKTTRKAFLEYLAAEDTIHPGALAILERALRDPKEPIGRVAYSCGLLTAGDVEQILDCQRQDHRPFGQIAVELGVLTERQLDNVLFIQDLRQVFEVAEATILCETFPRDEAIEQTARFLHRIAGQIVSPVANR